MAAKHHEEMPVGTFEEVDLKDVIAENNIRTDLTLQDKNKDMNLLESVKQHGVIEPVIIRKSEDGKYHLRAGYRRFLAAQQAGHKKIPAMIYTVDEARGLEMALIENLQRADMNPLDRALAFKDLQEKAGVEQQAIAAKLGISPGYVSQHFAILDLPTGVQKMIKAGKLEFTAARHLTRIKDAKVVEDVAMKVEGLRSAEVEDVVKNTLRKEQEKAAKKKENDRAKAREKAQAEGKPAPADDDEGDAEEPLTLVEQYKNATLKIKSETSMKKLLMEYADKLERSRSDERRKEYEYILKGLEMAAGVEAVAA